MQCVVQPSRKKLVISLCFWTSLAEKKLVISGCIWTGRTLGGAKCRARHSADRSTGRVLGGGDGDRLAALSQTGESSITGRGRERLAIKAAGCFTRRSLHLYSIYTVSGIRLDTRTQHSGWNKGDMRSLIEDRLTGSVHENVYAT